MADATIKTEIKPEIKLDHGDGTTAAALGDIEEFEDDVDLWIPPEGGQAWLVKVSEDMWKAWNDIYQDYQRNGDDQPMEIGKLRVYTNEKEPSKQKVQIRLAPGVPQHQRLPKEYNLDVKSTGYNNTVVFSEKDLPGHHNHRPYNRHLSGRPSGIQSKNDRYDRNAPRGKPGTYRTAIPKQTALAPPIHHEAVANPVPSASADDIWARQYQAAMEPKTRVTFLNELQRTNVNSEFTFGSMSAKPGTTSNKAGKQATKEKAVRMEKADLLDRITKCFAEYKYWSLKALRNRLRQPESYIKQALDEVAVLMRSGDFAMNYRLSDEFQQLQNMQNRQENEAMAPIKSDLDTDGGTGDDMAEGDEDDDAGDFEDVKMGDGE